MPLGILLTVLVAAVPLFLPAQNTGPAAAAPGVEAQQQPELIFSPVKIDGPVQDPAHHSYWFGPFAEAVVTRPTTAIGLAPSPKPWRCSM